MFSSTMCFPWVLWWFCLSRGRYRRGYKRGKVSEGLSRVTMVCLSLLRNYCSSAMDVLIDDHRSCGLNSENWFHYTSRSPQDVRGVSFWKIFSCSYGFLFLAIPRPLYLWLIGKTFKEDSGWHLEAQVKIAEPSFLKISISCWSSLSAVAVPRNFLSSYNLGDRGLEATTALW